MLADDTGDDVATEEQNNEDDEAGVFSYLRSALTELGEGMGKMIDYAETRMGLLEENTELETTPDADADAVQDTEAK